MQTILLLGCFTIHTLGNVFPLFALVTVASASIGFACGSTMTL